MKTSSGHSNIGFLGLAPAFILLLAGFAKLQDPTELTIFLQHGLDLPSYPVAVQAAHLIGVFEIVLAVGLAWNVTGRAKWPPLAAGFLFVFFIGLLIGVIVRKDMSFIDCGCFGSLRFPFVGKSFTLHLWMNGLLAFVCLFILTPVTRKEDAKSLQPA